MKTAFKSLLIVFWIMVSSILVSKYAKQVLHEVFSLPEFVWQWLINIYGVSNAEEAADLESLYALLCSFIVVSIVTFIVLRLMTKKNRTQ